jgi:23S rRNA (cytosine1962-C5)-methyltransferase
VVAEVHVGPRAARRLGSGHPWVYRDDVSSATAVAHGDLVRVVGPGRRDLGAALWSDRSRIALRRAAGPGETTPDATTWAERVDRALEWRARVVTDTTAWRALFAESDDVPGIVADVYGRHLVVQVLTAGSERILPAVADRLVERLDIETVLARNDSAVRRLEGLPLEVKPLRGAPPETIEVVEAGIRYVVDPWTGQKTGAFLDQRENRVALAALVGGAVLDAFGYQGNFALHAARVAERVVVVDSSVDALARGRVAAEANGLGNVTFVAAKVFAELRRMEQAGETFDAVLLDPPAFAKSRRDVASAERAYKEINLRAMRLLRPGGVLVTSSCSYNLGEEELMRIVADAAADARRAFRLVERRTQARDHPIRVGFPESRYLKCLALARM